MEVAGLVRQQLAALGARLGQSDGDLQQELAAVREALAALLHRPRPGPAEHARRLAALEAQVQDAQRRLDGGAAWQQACRAEATFVPRSHLLFTQSFHT